MRSEPTLLGLLLGVGLVLVVLSFTIGPPPSERAARRSPISSLRPVISWSGTAGTVVAGVVVVGVSWAVFAIPVLSIAGFVAVAGARFARVRAGEQSPRDVGETASTVARWIETVRDYLLTANTLNEAMVRASTEVRGRHAAAFARFAGTLTGAGGYERAAEDLAGELDNALADKALVALWIGNRGGGDLQAALGLLAESAQVEADNARRIEAGLAGTRRLIKIVLALCAVIFVLSLAAFRENYDVYRSAGGQLILAIGLATIGATWWSIWRLSTVAVPERLVRIRAHSGAP